MSQTQGYVRAGTIAILIIGIVSGRYMWKAGDMYINQQKAYLEEKSLLLRTMRTVREGFGWFNNSKTAYIIIEEDTHQIYYATDGVERMTGLGLNTLKNMTIEQLIPGDLLKPALRTLKDNPDKDIEFEGGGAWFKINDTRLSFSLCYNVITDSYDPNSFKERRMIMFEITRVSDRLAVPLPESYNEQVFIP